MNLTLQVTQKDIDKAIQNTDYCSDQTCPIAQALIRIGYRNVIVCSDEIFISKDGVKYSRYPEDLENNFMYNFDQKKQVYPTTFNMYFSRDN